MKTTLVLASVIALAAVWATAVPRTAETPAHSSQRFTALGDLPGGTFYSTAYGVSADGSVVVGNGYSNKGMEAFRWTVRGGMVGLGFSDAAAISADGSTVVGYRHIAGGSEPVRWMQLGGVQGLGNIAGYECGGASGTSRDGAIIVGSCERSSAIENAAFHWTQAGEISRLEHFPATVVGSEACAVSSDGKVIVGVVRHSDRSSAAFRWTAKGLVELGTLPGDTVSVARSVSADGSVVVGCSEKAGNAEAFRWTQKTGMVGLGRLPGGRHISMAFGVSADGSTIVGYSDNGHGMEAFVWDANQGMRSVRQLLLDEPGPKKNLRGWKLQTATAVSGDGSVIVGFGINPDGNKEAWMARLGGDIGTDATTAKIAAR
jgi:probable HAF family extracellular repeat protein